MDRSDRERILRNVPRLVNQVEHFHQLLEMSVNKNLFIAEMIEDIKNEPNETERKRKFFTDVTTRGPAGFGRLVSCLARTNNHHLLDILNEPLDKNDGSGISTDGQPMFTHDKISWGPIKEVKFQNADRLNIGLPDSEVYSMSKKPRGIVLAFINSKFSNSMTYPTREGAREDARLIREMFEALYFKVEFKENKNKSEVKEIVDEFITRPELKDFDACIVAVSSHGERDGFVCSDSEIYKLELLYSKFNNENCPNLREKPKLFFIQACRGTAHDAGVPRDVCDARNLDDEKIKREPASVPDSFLPTISDMLIVYSTQLGYVSFLNEKHGSWFFNSICQVFMARAHYEEIQHLLLKVNERISQQKSYPDSEKQASESVNRLKKKFYFNPGLPQ